MERSNDMSLFISMQNDIDTYITTYTSIKNIVTIHDLEHDLIQYMKSRCYPSLSKPASFTVVRNNDPNEIEIDEHIRQKTRLNSETNFTVDNSNHIPHFDDYGFGRLCSYPIIMQIFKLHHNNNKNAEENCCRCYSINHNTDLLNTNDIIQYLVCFIKQLSFKVDDDDSDATFTGRFIDYLNQQLTPLTLNDYGVYIHGDLGRERLIAQSIFNAENKIMVDIKRKQLENHKFIDLNGNGNNGNNNNNNNNIRNGNDELSIKFKSSDRPIIQGFLDQIKKTLDEGKSSSKSRTKILQAVQSHIDSSTSSSSTNESKQLVRMQLVEIAAEYAMLYLGKSSYRKKLVEVSGSVNLHDHNSFLQEDIADVIATTSSNSNDSNFETNRYMNNDIYNDNFTKLNLFKRTLNTSNDYKMEIMIIPPDELTACIPANYTFDINDTKSVGRWGEALVYQYLILKEKKSRITWMNIDVEERASYDITMITPTDDKREITTYIEVKSTRYPYNNVFELSLWEWEFATKSPHVNYNIYRVFNVGDPKTVRIAVIRDVLKMITEGSLKLCLAI